MTTSPSPPTQPDDLAIRAAADLIPCCVRTLRKAIALGFLPAYRIGHRIFVKSADLEAYVQNRAVPLYPDVLGDKTSDLPNYQGNRVAALEVDDPAVSGWAERPVDDSRHELSDADQGSTR